jgi:hypothetical protein
MKFSGTTVDLSASMRREAARLQQLGINSSRALQRATGTLLRRLPVQARRDIQAQYNLSARRINYDLHATRDASAINLIGRRRGIGLIQFGGRWGGPRTAGATAQIERGGARELWDGGGAFIAVGLSGNRQIFVRRGAPRAMTRGRYVGVRRQPIAVQYYGSIADFLIEPAREARLADFARTILADEMERLIGAAR